jgi:hypothetical protein
MPKSPTNCATEPQFLDVLNALGQIAPAIFVIELAAELDKVGFLI